jgi:hypothetical protein
MAPQGFPFEISYPVRRRADPPDAPLGFIVGVVFVNPHLALVRWPEAEPSFEPLNTLVAVYRPRL